MEESVGDRIAELEAQAASLQAQAKELRAEVGADKPPEQVSRRDVLGAAAVAAGAGVLGSYGLSGSASAQAYTATGTIGSSQNPLEELWAADIEAMNALRVQQQNVAIDVPISGSVQLGESTAQVDTGISDTDATYFAALGVDNTSNPCEVAARLRWANGSYRLGIVEQRTSIGNPTVNFDLVRVR